MLARSLLVCSLVISASAIALAADRPGCKDHAMFPTRMPGYSISDCKTSAFDVYELKLPKAKKQRVEGKVTLLTYRLDSGQVQATGVEVVRNYENAVTKLGGTIANKDPRGDWWVNGSVDVDGKKVWFEAEKGNGLIWLRLVEQQAMTQHIVADATAMGNDLERTGHVAVEGIYFDTNMATIRPESRPALEQIAKLLESDPKLKLWVVGHTDWVGKLDDNLRLSEARAAAVVAALTTTHHVAPARLRGFGVGPLAPVSSNQGEDGRARNRRVELVQQP